MHTQTKPVIHYPCDSKGRSPERQQFLHDMHNKITEQLAGQSLMTQTKQAKHTPPSEWIAKPTAGHDKHGQSVIYDAETGRDIAIVYDGKAHAERIVRAVNSHEELVGALQECLDYIEAEHAVRGMLLTADEFDWNVKHNKGKLGYVKIAANSTHQGVKADLTKARTAIAHATGE